MDQTARKRVRNHCHTKEIKKSEVKVKKCSQDSPSESINNEKNSSNNKSETSQERRNTPFVSVYTDQEFLGDPLQFHSIFHEDSQMHTNSDKDISESDIEDSEKCHEQDLFIDPEELEVIQQIKQWVIDYKIPHAHVNKLLKILKARLLPSIPLCTETLLEYNKPGKSENSNRYNNVKNKCNKEWDINVPVIDASNVQCKSNFEAFVLAQLVSQQSSMQRIENKLDSFVVRFLDKKQTSSKKNEIDFKKKYNLSFPIDDKHLFVLFNERLKIDKSLQNDVCIELNNHIDKDYSISKSFLTMIRAFITKNVAMQYTASRHSKENVKDIFKSTQFYECIEGVYLAARNKTSLSTYTNTELMSSLSDVLSNAKKWNEKK